MASQDTSQENGNSGDSSIYSVSNVLIQEIKGLSPEFEKLARRGSQSLLNPECRGVIITGGSCTGKSFTKSAIVSRHNDYCSKIMGNPRASLYFTGVSVGEILQGLRNIKKIVADGRSEARKHGHTEVCFLIEDMSTGFLLAEQGAPFILEIDKEAAERYLSMAMQKFPDIGFIDMDGEGIADLEEMKESIFLRSDFKTFNNSARVTRKHVSYFVDGLSEILKQETGADLETVPVAYVAMLFNDMAQGFILEGKKFLKTSIEDYVTEEAFPELMSLLFSDEELDQMGDVLDSSQGGSEDEDPTLQAIRAALRASGLDDSQFTVRQGMPADNHATPPADNQHMEVNDPDTIYNYLKDRIIGQDNAIREVADELLMPAAGLHGDKGVLASYLLLGPSGVGKTETARRLTEIVSKDGKKLPLIQFDMGEYKQEHEASKLYGAPPGYRSSENGGILTNAIMKNPRCILLLDEVEKAHPMIWDSFLHVFEDGHMTDNAGNVVDFSNVVVVMTSNLGSKEQKSKRSGFSIGNSLERDHEEKSAVSRDAMKSYFRIEFLNRIGKIIDYDDLSEENVLAVTKQKLNNFNNFLKGNGIELAVPSEDIIRYIAKSSDSAEGGARGIEKTVKSLVGGPVARKLIDSKDLKKLSLKLSPNGGVIVESK